MKSPVRRTSANMLTSWNLYYKGPTLCNPTKRLNLWLSCLWDCNRFLAQRGNISYRSFSVAKYTNRTRLSENNIACVLFSQLGVGFLPSRLVGCGVYSYTVAVGFFFFLFSVSECLFITFRGTVWSTRPSFTLICSTGGKCWRWAVILYSRSVHQIAGLFCFVLRWTHRWCCTALLSNTQKTFPLHL